MAAASDSRRHEAWEGSWKSGIKPGDKFDASKSSPALVELLQRDDSPVPKDGTGKVALVPGCGRGYDLVTFAKLGYAASGVEISETAAKAAEDYLAEQDCSPGSTSMIAGDYLAASGGADVKPGSADVIYDYTFFCAMQIDDRGELAAAHARALKPSGRLVTLQFPMAKEGDESVSWTSGPPFPLTHAIYTEHLGKAGFKCLLEEDVPASRSHPGRGGKERIAVWGKEE